MLEFELIKPEYTAAMWRAEDEQHSCAHCKHCRDTYQGAYCVAIEKAMTENGLPVKRVYIDDCESICDGYECNPKLFESNTGEYPKGYDAAELYTDPDEKRHEEREHEHATA